MQQYKTSILIHNIPHNKQHTHSTTQHNTTQLTHSTSQHNTYITRSKTQRTQHNTTQHTAQETNTACHSAEQVLKNVRICGTGSARIVCRTLEWTSRSCGDSRRKSRPRSCPVRQGRGEGRGEGGRGKRRTEVGWWKREVSSWRKCTIQANGQFSTHCQSQKYGYG